MFATIQVKYDYYAEEINVKVSLRVGEAHECANGVRLKLDQSEDVGFAAELATGFIRRVRGYWKFFSVLPEGFSDWRNDKTRTKLALV